MTVNIYYTDNGFETLNYKYLMEAAPCSQDLPLTGCDCLLFSVYPVSRRQVGPQHLGVDTDRGQRGGSWR